jgi:orotate phosphoribosyltransferase
MSEDLARRMIGVSELRGDFVLSSGARSTVYFDKFRFLAEPGLLRELAVAVSKLLPAGVTHLAAPEGAATLLLAAAGVQTGLPMAVVRKEPKAYGTMSEIEGFAPEGALVALLEDVSTTGQQVLRAARVLEDNGAKVVAIVLALDRGGADRLRGEGYDVRPVVSLTPEE